ncbi:MAG TPA: hypothetical protein VF747_10640 [Blastocatellia bacterium]|jgi:hypothetical protein
MAETISELRGFLPFQLMRRSASATLAWCSFRGVPLQEPFFIHDVYRRAFLPDPQFASTSLELLLESEEVLRGLKPNGFIFHMSSCGSTLLANMFRALPRNLSLGEPNVLSHLLACDGNEGGPQAAALFRNGVSALGQRRIGIEENYVIKFSSATTLFLPVIRKAFPDVPGVFLYRDPVEVLASNMKVPTQGWMFDAEVTGLDHRVMTEANTALENCAAALQHSIEAFLNDSDGNYMIANYSQFSPRLLERIIEFFGIRVAASEVDRMFSVGKHHAHRPGVEFDPDINEKRNAASPKVREVAQKYLGELYERLEEMRVRI